MVEAELVPTGLERVIQLAEKLIKFILNSVLIKNQEELEYFEKYQEKEIIDKLATILKKDFIRLDYTLAIKVLKASKEKFIFRDIK